MATPAHPRWRRRLVLGGMAAVIVLAHGWGLSSAGLALSAEAEASSRPGAFTVRTLAMADQVPAPPIAAAQAAPAQAAAMALRSAAASTEPAPRAAATSRASPAHESVPEPAPADEPADAPAESAATEPAEPTEAAAAPDAAGQARPQATDAASDSDAAPTPVATADASAGPALPEPADLPLVMAAAAIGPAPTRADTVEVPVYATRLAAAFSARYRLQRGMLSGTGTLRWSPSADGRRYEARLDGSVAGFNVLDWTSTGAIDRAGVAPERFLVRRRGRDAQAANFQRGVGKITYSGPSVQYDLPTGAQDRLSWMLQIGGVLNAAPKRFGVGSRLSFFVSGARGDADLWQFQVTGLESVNAGAGRDTLALKLVREPRKAYDTHVEVWLDPAREHRPVLARLSTAGNDDALELRLAE